MTADKPLAAEAWLTLRVNYANGKARGFVIEKVTQRRPLTDQPIMKLRVTVPAVAFDQFAPTVTVELPDGFEFPEPVVTITPEQDA